MKVIDTAAGTDRKAAASTSSKNTVTRGVKSPVDESTSPYHHGNLRQALILCGKKRLETEGVEVLSLRNIAADAGVTQAAPTHHFGNKEGLLAAIAADGFRDLTALRLAQLRPSMNAEQRARSILRSYVDFAHEHPSLFHMMFAPHIKNRKRHLDLDTAASESYQFLLRAMKDFIDERTQAGANILISPDEAARFAWCSMHGLASLLIEFRFNPEGAKRYSQTELTNRTIDLVLAAIQGR